MFELLFFKICIQSLILVSHTTDDLVFEWLPDEEIPLVVEPGRLFLIFKNKFICSRVH